MKRMILPALVGWALAVAGLVSLSIGKGLEFVVLTMPFVVILLIRVVMELAELHETNEKTNATIVNIIAATSSDFSKMQEYIDDELHEVYMTMANDRFDSD